MMTTQHAPRTTPPTEQQIRAACEQLGWQFLGANHLYGQTVAYLVEANGIIEPYTAEAILRQAALQRGEDDLDLFIRRRQARRKALQPA